MSSNGKRTRQTYTPNVRKPSVEKRIPRIPLTLVLLFLVPPVGLYLLWQRGVFRTRGRFILTLVSMVEMTCILALILPAQRTPTQLPIPSVPNAATVAPTGDVVNALSNMNDILAASQAAQAEDTEVTPAPTDDAAYQAEQEAILNTVVYSVYGNSAKYYHSVEICGTQTNRRQLTVREAMEEGLGACPNCDPPVYTG